MFVCVCVCVCVCSSVWVYITNVSMVLSAVYALYVVPGWKGSHGENQCVWCRKVSPDASRPRPILVKFVGVADVSKIFTKRRHTYCFLHRVRDQVHNIRCGARGRVSDRIADFGDSASEERLTVEV